MLAGALLVTLAGLTVFAFTRHGVYGTGGAATAAGLFAGEQRSGRRGLRG